MTTTAPDTKSTGTSRLIVDTFEVRTTQRQTVHAQHVLFDRMARLGWRMTHNNENEHGLTTIGWERPRIVQDVPPRTLAREEISEDM